MKQGKRRVSYWREVLFIVRGFLKSPLFFMLLICFGVAFVYKETQISVSILIAIAAVVGTYLIWGMYIAMAERLAIPDVLESALFRKNEDSRLGLFLADVIRHYQLGALLVIAFVFVLGIAKGISPAIMSATSAALLIPAFLPFLYSLTSFSAARSIRQLVLGGIATHRFDAIEALPFLTFVLVDETFEDSKKGMDSVLSLMKLGVRTRLITALAAEKALMFARECGIARQYDVALTGKDLNTLNDAELYAMLQTVRVFSNLLPHHEERIVQVLKRYGEGVLAAGSSRTYEGILRTAEVSASALLSEVPNVALILPSLELSHLVLIAEEGKRMLMRLERLLVSALWAFVVPVVMVTLGFVIFGKLMIPLTFLFGGTIIGLPLIPLLVLFDEALFGGRRSIRMRSFWHRVLS